MPAGTSSGPVPVRVSERRNEWQVFWRIMMKKLFVMMLSLLLLAFAACLAHKKPEGFSDTTSVAWLQCDCSSWFNNQSCINKETTLSSHEQSLFAVNHSTYVQSTCLPVLNISWEGQVAVCSIVPYFVVFKYTFKHKFNFNILNAIGSWRVSLLLLWSLHCFQYW